MVSGRLYLDELDACQNFVHHSDTPVGCHDRPTPQLARQLGDDALLWGKGVMNEGAYRRAFKWGMGIRISAWVRIRPAGE
jgi:hypothetical protein